jgi:hypothetical protein
LGGALVLGALLRLMKTARFRYGLLMSVGILLLALSRPYEGMLLCLPVAAVLGRWFFFGKNRPSTGVLIRRAAFPLALVVAGVAWLGYYDYRAFGSPLTLPYTVNRATYAMAPYFVWQSQRPEPVYRYEVMRRFYYLCEADYFAKIHSWSGFLPASLLKALTAVNFFAGIALLPPLIMLRRVVMDRRIRFLVVCVAILMAGMAIQIYLSAFTAAFYAIGLQAMRHLRLWSPEGRPVGMTLVRLCVTICFVVAAARLYAGPLHIALPEWPPQHWNFTWYGPDHFGTERARVASELEQLPQKQLAIVRYTSQHNLFDEWVYNAADIEDSNVIWAREMKAEDNLELLQFYKDRKVWLVEPDCLPAKVSPYSVPGQVAAGSQ